MDNPLRLKPCTALRERSEKRIAYRFIHPLYTCKLSATAEVFSLRVWISRECICWSVWYSSRLSAQVKHGRYAFASHHNPQSRRYTPTGHRNTQTHTICVFVCVQEECDWPNEQVKRDHCVYLWMCTCSHLPTCPVTSSQSPGAGEVATPHPEVFILTLWKGSKSKFPWLS